MQELTQSERELIDAARGAEDPSDEIRTRVRQAVLARIAAAAIVGAAASTTSPPTAAASSGAALGLFGKLLVGLGVLAIGATSVALATRESESPPAALAGMATRSIETTSTHDPSAKQSPTSTPVHAEGPAPTPPPVRPPPKKGMLREEVALLQSAHQALHAGDPTRALAVLDEHAAKHPSGALGQERAALRIDALCRLGRADEARAEARRFLERAPDSLLAERVRNACR